MADREPFYGFELKELDVTARAVFLLTFGLGLCFSLVGDGFLDFFDYDLIGVFIFC